MSLAPLRRLQQQVRGMRPRNPTRIVVGSFGLIILVGTLLLMLPAASRTGQMTAFGDCLFTATSASCVTGLVVLDTWSHWSLFGQVVILAMIQLGGLGFMTVITILSFLLRRRIGLSERLLMVSTLNLNEMDGVVRVVKHALLGTLMFEGAGALVLSVCFVPRFGLAGGIWRGVFHAVSAFCNAGFDLMGTEVPFSNLVSYSGHPVVLVTVMTLIAVGGLGFFVWEDIFRCRKNLKKLSLYSKLVLSMTGVLILTGAAFFLLAEWSNPLTLGPMPAWQKALNALFQSITLRTAGFDTIGQASLLESSMAVSCLLMVIGGSSGSTAGGLKTATVGVLLLTARATLLGREAVTLRGRTIPGRQVMHALTLTLLVGVVVAGGAMTISLTEQIPLIYALFEVSSAMGTVGMSAGLTPTLGALSRGLLIALMFLGRVGIMSFSVAFLARRKRVAKVRYPDMDIIIG